MGLLDSIKRLLGAAPSGASSDRGLYYFLRCDKCGEIIRFRVDPRWDLEEQFEESSDFPTSYAASKDVVGQKCFRTIHATIEFDRGKREVSRSASGAQFVTAQEFEQTREVPPPP